jgi:hypothetical protein
MITEIDATQSEKDTFNDWIEVYNYSDQLIDISNWMIKDNKENHQFVFPEGTKIEPQSFLIIAEDTTSWSSEYRGVSKVLGNLPFGINKASDKIKLYDSENNKVDEVNLKMFDGVEKDNMNWAKSDMRVIVFDRDNWNLEKPTPGAQSATFEFLLKIEEEDRYWKSIFFYSGISLGALVVLLFLFPLLRKRKKNK